MVSGGRCWWGLREVCAPSPGAEQVGLSGAGSVQEGSWELGFHCTALLSLHCTALRCFHCIP